MKNSEQKSRSKASSLLILIPALLLGIVSAAMAYVGLGLIPLLPGIISIVLGLVSLKIFKGSFRNFAYLVILISVISSLISVFRGVILDKKVAADTEFDSTLVKTQKGVDKDLQDAFGGMADSTGSSAAK
jgi:hypothetical protein